MTDADKLDEMTDLIYSELRKRGAAPTARNIIQMMFILRYADWLAGAYNVPTCPFE